MSAATCSCSRTPTFYALPEGNRGIFVGGGGFLGYVVILGPLWEKEAASAKLKGEIDDLDAKVNKLRKDVPRLQVANKRSLPTDENQMPDAAG